MSLRFDSFQMIRHRDYLLLSTKSNGISPQAEVIEIAAVDQDGKVLLNTLVQPEQALSEGVCYPHSISNSMFADAPSWPQVCPALLDVLKGELCVIWHAEFHLRLLLQTMERYQLDVPERFGAEGFFCAMRDYNHWQGTDENERKHYLPLRDALQKEQLMVMQQPSALSDCLSSLAVIRSVEQQLRVIYGF